MSMLLMKMLQPYRAPLDEGGDGGGANDRGDNLDDNDDKLPPSTIDDSKKDGDEETEEQRQAREAEELAARDPATGRFTKKTAPDDGEQRIPKSRFDDAVGKERAAREAAERRAAELEAQVRQEEKSAATAEMEKKVEELEAKYNDLILDGKRDEAAAVMKQIRMANREIVERESNEKLNAATSAAVEQVRMESAIAKLEADYPAFNPESEDFDQDLVDLVLAEQARLLRTTTTTPSKALLASGIKIMAKFAPPKPADDKVDDKKGLAAAKGADRKAAQVAKNLDTARRQPGSMKDAGKDSDKAGEKDMPTWNGTKEEFDALPDSTKAKLRGDFV